MKVKFGLNKELDKGVIPNFISQDYSKVNSAEDVVYEFHPKLRNVKDQKIIFDYIDDFYITHSDELKKKIVSFRKEWKRSEPRIVEYIASYFPITKFQKEFAYAYLTIIAVNPRWPEYKMFQLFYKMNSCSDTITHELMHFYFFEYCDKFHNTLFDGLSKENPSNYWHLSEVINNVLLSTNQARELLNSEGDKPYPVHEEIFNDINKIWLKTNDVDKLIIEGFKVINKWLIQK